MDQLKIGDRVRRRIDVYNDNSNYKTGTVTKKYSKTTQFGFYPEIYEVLWDNDRTKKGYLKHGLERIKP
jgi:hypothetical protein